MVMVKKDVSVLSVTNCDRKPYQVVGIKVHQAISATTIIYHLGIIKDLEDLVPYV